MPYYGIKACVCAKSPQAHTKKDALGARYARHLALKRAKNWSNFSCTPPLPLPAPPTRREVRCRAAHESQAAQVWVGGQKSHTIFIISSSIITVVIYQVPNYWQIVKNLESATAITSEQWYPLAEKIRWVVYDGFPLVVLCTCLFNTGWCDPLHDQHYTPLEPVKCPLISLLKAENTQFTALPMWGNFQLYNPNHFPDVHITVLLFRWCIQMNPR